MSQVSDISILQLVQQILQRSLSSLEVLILIGSWKGDRYSKMAQKTGYREEYLKQVGARLWSELSQSIGTTVTKKNLHLIFNNLPRSLMSQLGAKLPNSDNLNQAAPTKLPSIFSQLNPSIYTAMVQGEPSSNSHSAEGCLAFPSGPLSLASNLYIQRPPAEDIAFAEISQAGCLLCIKAPRRFGKTSFLWRVVAQATRLGHRVCLIDLQEADSSVFCNTQAFLQWFCRRIGHSLGLQPPVIEQWDAELGDKVNCGLYLQHAILSQSEAPLLLAINSLEQVFNHRVVAQDLLSMLQFWYEQAKDNELWQRLRLVLACGTESPASLNWAAPVKRGRMLELQPFTLEQFMELGHRYAFAGLNDPAQQTALMALYRLVGGHPYLSNLSFYALTRDGKTLSELLATAIAPNSVFRAPLQELLAQLRQNQAALRVFQQVVRTPGLPLNAVNLFDLESLGLVRVEPSGVYPACDLYQKFFAEPWVDAVPPDG